MLILTANHRQFPAACSSQRLIRGGDWCLHFMGELAIGKTFPVETPLISMLPTTGT